MARSPLRDIPPYDKATPIPDSMFRKYYWGFGKFYPIDDRPSKAPRRRESLRDRLRRFWPPVER